ncbi:MAG: hypothetical protein ABUL46_06310 [Chitinophaga rupis]
MKACWQIAGDDPGKAAFLPEYDLTRNSLYLYAFMGLLNTVNDLQYNCMFPLHKVI